MERFLYRLSKSPHAGRFILKGALMLRAWRSPEFRSTVDIDMLGRTSNEAADIIAQIRDIIAEVSAFLGPIAAALFAGTKVPSRWAASGPWTNKSHHKRESR